MTREISARAVFVQTRDCPRVGSQLFIYALLPSLSEKSGVRIRGEGVVLRVDHADAEISGFAVATCLRSEPGDLSDGVVGVTNN